MSSSYIVEPQEGASKKDDTLILMVNDNGVISVDQDTLQNLILNQSNASVSVVRLGQTENDAVEGNLTLTVDPPPFIPSETNVTKTASDSSGLLDPFMEMDQEQLERLETALQSEAAKQILGENVTAMLDMLTVEERQNSIRYSIELDHCYTSRFSPSQPKPVDPLPDISISDMDESVCIDLNKSLTQTPILLPVSSANVNNSSITPIKQKVTPTPPKIVKQPVSVGSRPRRASAAMQPITTTPKSTVNSNNSRSMTNSLQQENLVKNEREVEENELFSSSESSESEESDSDSDYGTRNSRRGVRARGGRRGLTTRGGSMTAARRRAPNKQMDSEQVRRLDMEMAAAVNAMKSPEKEEKPDKISPIKPKKPLKTLGGKKKDDVLTPSIPVSEPPPIETNVLQTTNQVKANLISANMFKGDMILTKPGQDRNNQKVVFVQKQVLMNPNEIKTYGIKKQVMIPKSKLITNQGSKIITTKESKVSPTIIMKGTVPTVQQPIIIHQNVMPMETPTESNSNQIQLQKQVTPPAIKTKPVEVKKEKKKVDVNPNTPVKTIIDPPKVVETKTPVAPKKIVKKEHRKSETLVVEALGPALFSTPDIIRRVGSTSESKIIESPVVTTTCTTPVTVVSSTNTPTVSAVVTASTISTSIPSTSSIPSISSISTPVSSMNLANLLDEPMETNESINDSVNDTLTSKLDADASMLTDTLEDVKMDSKTAIADLLQPTLDSTTNTTPSKEMPPAMEHSNSSKHVSESGIEGDEHLLATLGMEAAKQLPNDEELLAEALLLQETLGVDLDNSGLVDPTNPEMPESILSSPIIEPPPPPPITAPPIKTESTPVETPPAHIMPEVKTEPILKKDVKEPIQYVRGGRVITLPPIEAPATRSKRLQAKAEIQQAKVEKKPQIQEPPPQPKVEPIIIKTERSTRTPTHVSLKKQDMIYDMDDDDEEEEEANSDSEDDPNRLWCICRQPHNNRFMICCDMCQDWFHGKCVHVTKAMGEQMENQGIEWVCPNCSKKKNEENKAKAISKRQRNSVDTAQSEKNRTPSVSNAATPNNTKAATNSGRSASTSSGVTYCVVCKKEARKASIYCSDACIWAHAEVTSTKDKPSPAASTKPAKTEVPKLKPDTRIIVYDKKSGKVLTGADAPTPLNLKAWLKEHPTYEVVKSNNFNTIQMGGKTVTAIQTQGIKTNKQLQGKSPGQAKMIYTKVPASKQTILTSSAKKTIQLSETPSTSSPLHRPRQAGTPNKTPIAHLKQTSIKTALQQQQVQHQQQQHQQQQQHHYQQQQQQQHFQISQKPIATSTPKASFSKKQEARASTSQQKQPLQKSLQQQPKQSPQQPKQQQLQPKQQQQQQSKQQQQQQPKQQQQQQQLKQQQQQQQQPKQQQQQQQTVTKTPPPKKPDTEPIRLTVRKTLAEHLTTRIKETKDLSLTEEEILEITLQIELEMFKFFKDAGTKYRAKYRSLLFNIKDPKNLTLFRKIVDRSLTPEALVKLSPEEMASQELAEWRKKENKHQLEMIKKNELDLMSQAKSIVVKTHKGEQIIENDGAIDQVDPATPVQDIVTALNSGDAISSTVEDSKQEEEDKKFKLLEEEKKKKEKDRDREKRRGRSRDRSSKDSKRDRSSSKSKHRHKDRDRSRDKKSKKESKHKDRDRTKDKEGHKEHKSRDRDKKKDKEKKHKRSRSSSRSHSKNRHKDHKEKHKKEEDKKKEIIKTDTPVATPDKTIEDRLWRHIEDETTTNTFDGNDSDISDREPSSTVTIKTPDFNDELEKEIFETKIDETPKGTSTVWRGFVFMADVAKFFVTAQNVSGNSKEIMDKLPDHLDVVGRISPVTVWDYISKMKKNATKEIIIIRLTAVNDEEKIPYITLYSYLNSRNRFGVLGNISPIIKDFYIMPFPIGSKLPSVLLPLDGPGFEENRQHLLLGILVVHSRKKRTANVLPAITPVPAKIAKKEQQTSDRSYTPPPMNAITKDESMTPPSSPKPAVAHIKIVTQEVKETYSVISKIVPELSSKITLESSSSSDKMQLDDDDEPYSPGEPVDVALDEDEDALSTSSSLKLSQSVADTTAALTAKSSTTELQRQMEKISRQIEEERQQILTITSSYTSANDASSILPGLGLDPPDSGDTVEAYSPSDARSFTPPPQGISKLTQPILEKVSNITIPANLHEILANVKRQESTTVDPYLPSKPSATFLTTVNSAMYQNQESYSPTYNKTSSRLSSEVQSSPRKETKSTLSSLSDYDLMKKAEEELAALEAAEAATSISGPAIDTSVPPPIDTSIPPPIDTSVPPPSDTTISLPIDTSIPPPTMSVPPPLMSVPPPTMSVPPPTILVPPPTISPACNEPPPPGASFDTPHR